MQKNRTFLRKVKVFIKKVQITLHICIGHHRFFLSLLLSFLFHVFLYWMMVGSKINQSEVFRSLDFLGEPQGRNIKVKAYKALPENEKHELRRKFLTIPKAFKKPKILKKVHKAKQGLALRKKSKLSRANTLSPSLDKFLPNSEPNFLNELRKSVSMQKIDMLTNASKGTRIKNANIKNHLENSKSLPLLESPLFAFEKQFNEKFHKVWGPIRYGPQKTTFNAVIGEFIIFDVYIDKKTGVLIKVINISEQNDLYRDYKDINHVFNSVVKDMFPYPLSSHIVKYIDENDNAIILSVYIRIV